MGPRGMDILRRHQALLAGLAILVMVLVAYIPAMRGGFIWDDDKYVTENPLLTAPDGLRQIWFSLNSPSQYFPLVYTTFRVERAHWGLNPAGYHVVNILLHATNALLIWLILRRLSIRGAWSAAAIFALHPVQVESVAWITERKNVLSTLFYLLTVIAWMRFADKGEKKYYVASLVSCALALSAKTTACTVPAALLMVLWIRKLPITWKRLVQVIPFAAISIFMGMVTIWWERVHQGTQGAEFALSPAERILIAGRALWFYLGKLVWPSKLAFSYPQWRVNAADATQWVWPVACLALLILLWQGRRAWGSGPLIAAAFFAALLSPMLGFISLYTFRYTYVADHYQYLAALGPIALFSALVRREWRSPAIGYALPAVILCVLGVLTWRQACVYKDAETLWTDTLAKNPTAWIAHDGLGAELSKQGVTDEALAHYDEAIRLRPDHWEGYINKAVCLADNDRLDEAIPCYEKGLRLLPRNPGAHFALGNAYSQKGRLRDAEREYRESIGINPHQPDVHANLAAILTQTGRYDDAIAHYAEALRDDQTHAEAWQNLAVTYFLKKDYARAWQAVHTCEALGIEVSPDLVIEVSTKMPDPSNSASGKTMLRAPF